MNSPTRKEVRRRRPVQSQLRSLRHDAREQLHGWLRETITYKEVKRRLKERFDIETSVTALSDYFRDKRAEIKGDSFAGADAPQVICASADKPTTLLIRIEVPPGCRVGVSTETSAAGEKGASS